MLEKEVILEILWFTSYELRRNKPKQKETKILV